MSNGDDIDMLSAEYVLGTLPAAERTEVARRLSRDKPLADAIEAWERRLGPLSESVAPREAPARIWPEIEARIDMLEGAARATPRPRAQIVSIERRLRRWRAATVAVSALAASLLLFVGYREFARPVPEKTLVAVLQKDAQSPAFLVSVDLESAPARSPSARSSPPIRRR
jgi:anti-sigma-K factor RskA